MIRTRTEDPLVIEAKDADFKTKYMTGNPAGHIDYLQTLKIPFYVRETEYTISIILDNREYTYCMNAEFNKVLYLIRFVKKDFQRWLDAGNKVDPEMYGYRSSHDNCMFRSERKTVKYDVDHAYWQIAFNHGMISQNTYNHGLKIKAAGGDMKKMYCVALSVQGSGKSFNKYKEKKKVPGGIKFPERAEFRKMYDFIRNKTFYHMDYLAYKLGNEFKSYDVDCIEFADTKINCTFVSEYFKQQNLSFKIL